ncbi:hypothetical protein GCM10023322_75430 [Rugosimonospora acidiphila]|uniref:Fibronectin type-III domain-containing protein n=1 Tax=Rugosimonospora acidiphila TaxID=556531 RepID=A0ABP9SRT4_9ACTN
MAARDLLEPAVDVAAAQLGSDDPAVVETQRRLATVHRELGELSAARRVLEEALEGGLLGLGEADPLILLISAELGAIADELGNKHEARRNLARVARYGPTVLGPDHPYVRTSQRYLGVDVPPPPPTQVTVQPPEAAAPPGPRTPADADETVIPVEPGVYRPVARDEPSSPQPEPTGDAGVYLPPNPVAFPGPGGPGTGPPGPGIPMPTQRTPTTWQQHPAPPARGTGNQPYDWAAPGGGPWSARPGAQRPAPSRPRSRGPLIAMAVITLAVVVAGVAIGVFAFGGHHASPQGSPPATSPSASTRLAPTDVRLRDNGVSVTLTWTDPSSGRVPFVVAGGRAGEESRAFQTLPAGQSAYTVNGLNPDVDYCFTVVAVYTTNEVATSALTCTQRTGHPTISPSR